MFIRSLYYDTNYFGGILLKDNIIVPVWEKLNLTIEEAARYSNIGINKINELVKDKRCPFLLCVGNKRLIKRREFEKYIEKVSTL